MLPYYKKGFKFYIAGYIFCFLFIGIGFLVGQCLIWPKEFRGGVFNKLSAIHATNQRNEESIRTLENRINELNNFLEFSFGRQYKGYRTYLLLKENNGGKFE